MCCALWGDSHAHPTEIGPGIGSHQGVPDPSYHLGEADERLRVLPVGKVAIALQDGRLHKAMGRTLGRQPRQLREQPVGCGCVLGGGVGVCWGRGVGCVLGEGCGCVLGEGCGCVLGEGWVCVGGGVGVCWGRGGCVLGGGVDTIGE